jgi:hypothetical protein
MARVLPSDAVSLIEHQFPWVISGGSPSGASYANCASLAGVTDVVEQIPDSLLSFSGVQRSDFLFAISSLRHLVNRLESGTSSAGGAWPWPTVGNTNVVTRLWMLLKECPDEAVSEATDVLEFMDDTMLRQNLRRDLSSADDALNNGEWKAATVLAGALVESLLLWAIGRRSNVEIGNAITAASLIQKPDAVKLENWNLAQYIEVAFALNIISESTATQARLAKEFRNLIHPGREKRTRMQCDRGTARTSAAALDLVIREIRGSAAALGTL